MFVEWYIYYTIKTLFDKILHREYYVRMSGRIPKPEIERDAALISDYLMEIEGKPVFSIAQLGIKYARVEDGEIYPLTATRIHQILNKYEVTKARIVRKHKKKAKRPLPSIKVLDNE